MLFLIRCEIEITEPRPRHLWTHSKIEAETKEAAIEMALSRFIDQVDTKDEAFVREHTEIEAWIPAP